MISVVLPTYQEAATICALVDALRVVLVQQGEFEIVVVDDASPDGTADVVRAAHPHDQRVRVLMRQARGLAGAVRTGCEAARGSVIVVMDSDFNHPPEQLPELLAALAAADLVVGSRYLPGGGMPGSRLRFLLSGLYNLALRRVLALPTRDALSGFFVFRASLLRLLPADAVFVGYGDYAIRLIQAVHRAGGRIREVPVRYGCRPAGESTTRWVHHFVTYTRTVMELRRRPVEPLGRCGGASS